MGVTDRSVFRRVIISAALSAVVAASVFWPALSAQSVGRNVNMVSGVTWPDGDPFLQRQNEPSLAASTRNPQHLLAGSNDYRSVDLPGLPDSEETGDAWLGLFKSFDGGARWTSNLLPGYPQDTSPSGLASPLKGYQAAADPVVRPGANGLLFYAGLAFDRAPQCAPPGKSAIFVARFIDNNNLEAGDPIRYLGTSLVASVPAGDDVFLDKPLMAVDVPRPGAPTCQVVTPGPDGSLTQRLPAGTIYLAFMRKTIASTGDRFDIMLSRSIDCGATFSVPIRVSRAEDRVNQGATIAISPVDGELYSSVETFRRDGRRRRHPRGPFRRSRPQLPAAWHRSQVPPRPQERRLRSLEVHAAAAEQGRRPAGGGRGLPVRSGHLRRLLDGL